MNPHQARSMHRLAVGVASLIAAVATPQFANANSTTNAPFLLYSYTGTTLSGDSSISAWFQFAPSALSDGLVFFYEINQHSFQISGNNLALNGLYDHFLGGGLTFHTTVPGPENLPSSQTLVIQNSATRFYVTANAFADPAIFTASVGDLVTVYHGQWAFTPVPEPGALVVLAIAAASAAALCRFRTARAAKV